MAKFHINDKGEAGSCRAEGGGCPFGGAENHYSSATDARAAYEALHAENTFVSTKVDRSKSFQVKQTWDDSAMVGHVGAWDSIDEARQALKEIRQDPHYANSNLELVENIYTVKTVAVSEEVPVSEEPDRVMPVGTVKLGARAKVPASLTKLEPKLAARGGAVAELTAMAPDGYVVRFSDGETATIPRHSVYQLFPQVGNSDNSDA